MSDKTNAAWMDKLQKSYRVPLEERDNTSQPKKLLKKSQLDRIYEKD